MSKRGAISDLNDRNWDEEEEPEEAGVFQQASDTVLQQRTFKKAKRRVVPEDNAVTKPAAFGGFSGFGLKPAQSKAADSFFGFKPKDSDEQRPQSTGGAASVNGSEEKSYASQRDSKDSYLNFLKSLNESVLSWIKQHVEDNPYIILTPIFKDYETYLKNAQSEGCTNVTGARDIKSNDNGSITSKTSTASQEKGLTFPLPVTATDSSTTKAPSIPSFSSNITSSFKFGQKTETSTSATPTFSFGSTSAQKTGFSFDFKKTSQDSTNTGTSQEADTKVYKRLIGTRHYFLKEIVEEGALFSIRCKLFHQKEGQWVDRGVGNLHLKPVQEEKTQLLVRADTNLGNILLNIMMTSTMPFNKQGKNNVVFMCVPNPPIDTKGDDTTPVPMLIRVKTEEDAEKLLKQIKERQQLL
uniref:RanBD1 domain-containing protein n=1 Tax=Biomphalaria glabrata TaxID=6526 RepID=A0A2C9JRM7_BIOGL